MPALLASQAEAQFLLHLTETADVALAARRAEIDIALVHAHRRRNASFRAAWEQAIVLAYDDLELALLRRARFGRRKPVKRADGKQGHMTDYDDAQALRLLLAHRQAALQTKAAAASASEVDDPRDRLAERIADLGDQLAGSGDFGPVTSA